MAITEHDLELFAARIRPHFPSKLRDTAYKLALSIARIAGPKVKLLTPDTTIDTILEWTGPLLSEGSDSLDSVEHVMALEEEFGSAFVLPDEMAARMDHATFRDWVEHAASKRKPTSPTSRTSDMGNALRNLVGLLLVMVIVGPALTAVAADPKPTDALASLNGTRSTYLVVYRRGSSWVDGKPMSEQQSMREHFQYYVGLHRKGLLIAGGGFTDESGGAAVFEAASDAAASAIIAADPAVTSKTFQFELERWKPNPWEEISRKRAARGE